MATFVRGANPIWFEVDLTANAFDDTFYLFVLQNDLPYLPAVVYHDPEGNIPWTNPIRFLANGTLPIDIYFDPDVVYRLEFRHGNTQADPLIYLVENYVASGGGSTPSGDTSVVTDNQITNAQFSIINFVSPFTLTSVTDPDPIELAPGWSLVLEGTGSVTLTRVALSDSASTVNPTNAPYALRITLSGTFTTQYLAQRFNQNGNLWSSGALSRYVASSITARLQGANADISAILVNSEDETLTTVLSSTTLNESWNEYLDVGLMPQPQDGDTPPDSYLEYRLILPNNIDIYVTSFQLVAEDLALRVAYNQDSIERQVDYTFHYYKDQLVYKPIPSYLVGWDFTFNPCQALGPTVAPVVLGGPNLSRYIADQTILFTSVDNSIGMAQSFGGFNFSTSIDSSFAIIQYIDNPNSQELLKNKIASQIQAIANTTIPCEINLYWTADGTLPSLVSPTCQSLVSAVSALGVPTIGHGTWHKVPRANGLGDASFNVVLATGPTSQTYPTYSFNGWDDTQNVDINTATYFAIVVSFGTLVAANQIVIDHISLCAGDIATRPAPLSISQTLLNCQRYYETNYPTGAAASGANTANLHIVPQSISFGITGGGTVNSYGTVANSFNIPWETLKRTNPTVTLSSQDGSTASVSYTFRLNNTTTGPTNLGVASFWTSIINGTKGITYQVTQTNFISGLSASPTGNLSSWISFNYIADARLGLVN